MNVELINYMGSDLTIVNSARVSFNKQKDEIDDKDIKLIKYLIKNKHVSTLEHCFFTFKITAPIYIARQFMRHRSWSFNEISGRYVEFDEKFYIPDEFRYQAKDIKQGSIKDKDNKLNQEEINTIYSKALDVQYNAYKQLIELGVAREQARGLLGTALMTEFYASCNLRSLVHFLEARLNYDAQLEARVIAQKMLECVKNIENNPFKHSLSNFNFG